MKKTWKDIKEKVKRMDRRTLMAAVVVMIALLALPLIGSQTARRQEKAAGKGERSVKYWTCSMHPQIRLPNKGLCPICAMDLIPVYHDGDGHGDGSDVSLTLNETARQLAEVETSEVKYEAVINEVRLVGKVDYDETRLSYISAWVPGRIDRLYVDFTGTQVRKGDHLIELYSPELISAQQEYIQAIKNWEQTKDSELNVMKGTAEATLKSAK
jgi:Cu(I)/Ag(I) efflux system membrane fusion protein